MSSDSASCAVARRLGRQIASFVVFLFLLHAMLFAIFDVLPQSSAAFLGWAAGDAEFADRINTDLGLSGPWYRRYFHHLIKICRLDLGHSSRGAFPVRETLVQGLVRSLPLLLACCIGVAVGFWGAIYMFIPRRGMLTRRLAKIVPSLMLLPPFIFASLFYAAYRSIGINITAGSYAIVYWSALLLTATALPTVLAFAAASRVCDEISRAQFVRTYVGYGLGVWRIRRLVSRNVLLSLRAQTSRLLIGGLLSCGFTEIIYGLPGFGRIGLIAFRDSDFSLMFGWAVATGTLIYFLTEVSQWDLGPQSTTY